MNRAQRRLERFGQRPSGQFLGELQRRALNSSYQQLLRTAQEQEANGKPIDPEIAERMTKPNDEQLYQVVVKDNSPLGFFHASPIMGKDACGSIAETINRQVIAGKRPTWGMAEVMPVQRIQGAS